MPGSDRLVVVNATPIITLAIVDQLELLRHLYPRLVIPEAVHREVLAGGNHRPGARQLAAASWIQIVPLQDPRRADLLADLDRGEAEVLALAQELDASLVILDERLGRRHATRLGFVVTGTIGVLLLAKEKGRIERVAPFLGRIQAAGIRFGVPLVQQALQLAGETDRV